MPRQRHPVPDRHVQEGLEDDRRLAQNQGQVPDRLGFLHFWRLLTDDFSPRLERLEICKRDGNWKESEAFMNLSWI